MMISLISGVTASGEGIDGRSIRGGINPSRPRGDFIDNSGHVEKNLYIFNYLCIYMLSAVAVLMKTRDDFNRIQFDENSSTHESNKVQSSSTREARQKYYSK